MPSRAQVLVRMRLADKAFQHLTHATALAVLGLLGCIIVSLVIGSLPALRAFGFDFLVTQKWNPVTERFGALAPIYGTLITSLIAMAIAVCSVHVALASDAGHVPYVPAVDKCEIATPVPAP